MLLSGDEETDITNFFIESAFPTREEVEAVLGALKASAAGLSVPELLGEVNISKGRIDKTIDLLALESPAPLAKQGTKWQLTAAELSDDFWTRAERLTDLRHAEREQMQEYVDLRSGHMPFLLSALDSDPSNVSSSALALLPTTASMPLVQRATAFLRRTSLPIEPRKKWPVGGLPQYGVTGMIAQDDRAGSGQIALRVGGRWVGPDCTKGQVRR